MQTIFENQSIAIGCVRHQQLEPKGVADIDVIIDGKGRVGRSFRRFRQAKPDTDAPVRGRSDFLHFPGLNAGKAVLTHSLAMPKPWENYRNTTADGVVLIEAAALAEEE